MARRKPGRIAHTNQTAQDAARSHTATAIKRGDIIRPKFCSACGWPGIIEAHHTDYKKPEKIQWLCHRCHSHEHLRRNRALFGADKNPKYKFVRLRYRLHETIKKEAVRLNGTISWLIEKTLERKFGVRSSSNKLNAYQCIRGCGHVTHTASTTHPNQCGACRKRQIIPWLKRKARP